MARKCLGCNKYISDDKMWCSSCGKSYLYSEGGLYDPEEVKAMGDGDLNVYERPNFIRLNKIQLNRAVQEVEVFLMQTDQDIKDYYLKEYYPDMTEKEINQAIKDINKEASIRTKEEKESDK